jgi:hypothetical protein
MRAMKKRVLGITGAIAVVVGGGSALANESNADRGAGVQSAAKGPPPFAAIKAAATGREVAAALLPTEYVDVARPRVVGADPVSGQEYAFSVGTGGNCLIAVRGAGVPGFESCSPLDRDRTTVVYLGEGRIRTIVLQAEATSEPPSLQAVGGGKKIAPGLWVSESTGALPGG